MESYLVLHSWYGCLWPAFRRRNLKKIEKKIFGEIKTLCILSCPYNFHELSWWTHISSRLLLDEIAEKFDFGGFYEYIYIYMLGGGRLT